MTEKANSVKKGGAPDFEDFDAVAGAELVPGMLVEVTDIDDDGVRTVQPHSTDGEAPQTPLFVDILPYSGDQSDDTVDPVDDPIPSGGYAHVVGAHRYNRVNAILAAGADITTGTDANVSKMEDLTSAGDGTLRSTASGGTGFAHATEDVDNSGAAAGETARLITEVQ